MQFDRLRWGMTRQEVFATYKTARVTPSYEGRHPLTGERFTGGGDVMVPAIHEAVPGVKVNATLAFDAGDRLAQIDLWPDDERAEIILPAIHALAGTLGVGPVDEADDEQSWTVDGTTITLTLDDGFRFEMAPTSAASSR